MSRRTAPLIVAALFVVFAGCSSPDTTTPTPKPEDKAAAAPATEPTVPPTTTTTAPDASTAGGAKPATEMATVDFDKDVVPLLGKYCAGCHGGSSPKGGLDLSKIKTKDDADAMKPALGKAASYVESRRMPPRNATQLTPEERQKLVTGLRSL